MAFNQRREALDSGGIRDVAIGRASGGAVEEAGREEVVPSFRPDFDVRRMPGQCTWTSTRRVRRAGPPRARFGAVLSRIERSSGQGRQ